MFKNNNCEEGEQKEDKEVRKVKWAWWWQQEQQYWQWALFQSRGQLTFWPKGQG
jgi:hypothetical protein